MNRIRRAVVMSVLLAMCLAVIFQFSSRLSAAPSSTTLTQARSWVAKALQPTSTREPVLRKIASPVRLAQSGGGTGTSATIRTDKSDYPPSTNVTVLGDGWQPNEPITLKFEESPFIDGPHIFFTVADANGDVFDQQFWTDSYDTGLTFTLTATGASGQTAQTTFTDAGGPSANLDQCANDPAPSPSSNGCATSSTEWVNGNLGESKSVYFEGDSIPYRMRFDDLSLDIPGGTVDEGLHAVTIKWDTTKSSKHALDYLTTYNRTVANANPCLGITFPTGFSCNPTDTPGPTTFDTEPIPKDPQVDNGSGSPIAQIAGNFTLFGGTILSVDPYVYPDGSGFANDKSAQITIHFHANVANPVLAWGGHIATRQNWGPDASAVAIPGSPYHMALAGSHDGVGGLDGKGGAQDRSLSAAAVVFPGGITIIKDATPNGSTQFSFTASPTPLADFTLKDDGTSANTKVFSITQDADFKSYTVGESVPSGWSLTNISCGVTSPNGGSRTIGTTSVTINLKEGEFVSCTFSNQQDQGTLKLVKNTVGGDATFPFTHSIAGLDASLTTNGGTANDTSDALATGTTYAVSEGTLPAGWDFTSASCTLQSGASTGTVNGQAITGITVEAGKLTTCTFTNTKRGTLKLVKNTLGGDATFPFTHTIAGLDASLTTNGGTANDTSDGLAPGTSYAMSEGTLPAGWNFTSAACTLTGGASTGAVNGQAITGITVEAGKLTTCTFTNTKQGTLKLVKNTVGGDATFPFTHTIAGLDASLTTNGGTANDTSDGLAPGTSYAVSEGTLPAGWNFTSAVCTLTGGASTGTVNGQAVTAITVEAGKLTTCTFSNTKEGLLRLVKNTVGGDGTFAFTHSIAGLDASLTTNGGTASDTSDSLAPGATYTVSEGTLPAGWNFTSAACTLTGGTSTGTVNGQAITAITVEAGKTTTCTFTNTKRGYLKLVKNTVGGDGTFSFTHYIAGLDTSLTTNGGTANDTSDSLAPGATYAVRENTVPAGWDFTSAACTLAGGTSTGTVNGQAITAITVEAGKTTTCTFTNTKRGTVRLLKLTNGAQSQTMVWNFTLNGPGVNTSGSTPPPLVTFGGVSLTPGASSVYTICETGIPSGWTLEWKVDTNNDGTADTIIPFFAGGNAPPAGWTGYSNVYDPNYVAPPNTYTNDTRCVRFTVTAGQTLVFQINNSFPGGEPRTIGYWKNWSSCTGGNQVQTAAKNGGPVAGWYILDNLLNDPGYHLGPAGSLGLQLDGNAGNALTGTLTQPSDCIAAVRILDKSKITDAKKLSSDGAYNLAAQYLAALLNLSAGAETCSAVQTAVTNASALLANVGFNGTAASYLKSGAQFATANSLANTLDQYNNGNLCQ